MDTTKLVAALDQMIAQDRPIDEKIFLRLLKEVWQVDWTVAPYDALSRMMDLDILYFSEFMALDEGDEAEENTLIDDWISARRELRRSDFDSDRTGRFTSLVGQLNHIRMNAR